MKSELVEQLLLRLMRWDQTEFQETVRELEALATYKFDEYGNFSPGMKFFESLASWLGQFTDEERVIALEFVLTRLLFVSDAQMIHLIELVYPDHMEPVLRRAVASHTPGSKMVQVTRIVESSDFAALRRRSLILGASDGARLDRLRRSAPTLSHEQFLQSTEPPIDVVTKMVGKLDEALATFGVESPGSFDQVFLVDDFAGSGETLIRHEGGGLAGKLPRLRSALDRLAAEALLTSDYNVTIVIYVASEQARRHVNAMLADESGFDNWALRVVQEIPLGLRVDVSAEMFADLANQYYDEALTDDIKGQVPLGYSDCALPLVLSHNTPNNSVALLWADTPPAPGGLGRRALFPRYERHHRDRP